MATCPHCSRSFPGDRLNARHLAVCNPTSSPDVPPCLCGHVATSLTQMKRHKRECALWQARDPETAKAEAQARKKATSLARYGVEDASQAPEVIARREATNVARYGAANPFSKGASTFQKVQDSMEGKRPILKGDDNPFSRPEIQEKARQSMVERYGAANPQQVPTIRARTRDTMHTQYGGELLGSPVIRAKANVTNLAKYGTTEPSRTPEVVERARQTNLARYGVEWTNQDPDVRRWQLEAMHARYGSHYFASDEGKLEVRAALMERYGVEFPGAIDGHWEKAVAAFQERYGVDHPLQLDVFLDKRAETCREVYGVDSPLQNAGVMAKLIETNRRRYGVDSYLTSDQHKRFNIAKYGVDHPMKNQEYARKHLERMRTNMNPTLPERLVASYAPSLLYTGNRTFWRWFPTLKKHKNPDFILPGPDPAKPKKGVTRVVEVFGDFWHSRMFTGKAPFDHEQELIEAYADIGIRCLILWESEVKTDPEGVRARLTEFCGPTW